MALISTMEVKLKQMGVPSTITNQLLVCLAFQSYPKVDNRAGPLCNVDNQSWMWASQAGGGGHAAPSPGEVWGLKPGVLSLTQREMTIWGFLEFGSPSPTSG